MADPTKLILYVHVLSVLLSACLKVEISGIIRDRDTKLDMKLSIYCQLIKFISNVSHHAQYPVNQSLNFSTRFVGEV